MSLVLVKSKAEMARVMSAVFAECQSLRKAGQKEYAGGENAFGNFNRISQRLGLMPEQVLMTFFTKHLDGIEAWIRGHRSQREPVRGRIKDAIVYLCLLAGMVECREAANVVIKRPSPRTRLRRLRAAPRARRTRLHD